MQKRVCNILVIVFIALASTVMAAPSTFVLKAADSSYNNKQYTQALDLYKGIYKEGNYSASMLLKMAHIQEGLGHLGESLYYLNLYFIASDDAQALKKMEELAEKNNLEGYKTNDSTRALAWLQEHYNIIAWLLASITVFLFASMYYQRVKLKIKPAFTGMAFAITLTVLFIHVNFSLKDERGIVAGAPTYLMDGPSAGASVVAIIGEGHQLEIKGKKDVWLRVAWRDQEVFVKDFLIREIKL
ncbi:MAG: hypothetical protein HOP08_12210 [Cyclobacteriaceae bacterium]|nr:hypothetical protein [Cyclobacteriaceae bacterium]